MASLDISKISVAAFLQRANKGSARRCLFGPVNHEENTRLLREQLACQEKESMEKWNFDFRTETPVRGGRFNWVKVDSSADQENQVPVAYSLPQLFTTTTVTSTTKSRVCSPLTFSAKVNRLQKQQDEFSAAFGKNKLDFSPASNAAENASPVSESLDTSKANKVPLSPAGEREPVTTVPVLKKFRDETPTVQELSAACTKVSEQITPESTDAHHQESSASSAGVSKEDQAVLSPSCRSPTKRKLAQSDITEFFPVKKSRNISAVNSAKRRLDL